MTLQDLKKIILLPLFKLVSAEIIRKPLFALLNRFPRLKQLARELYVKYFLRILGETKGSVTTFSRDTDFEVSDTHRKLLDYVLERNSSNPDLNEEINRLILALQEMDSEYIELQARKENFHNIIIACYLFLLRRYPSEIDIDLWTDHFAQGATVYTILDALKSSVEFQEVGVYYL